MALFNTCLFRDISNFEVKPFVVVDEEPMLDQLLHLQLGLVLRAALGPPDRKERRQPRLAAVRHRDVRLFGVGGRLRLGGSWFAEVLGDILGSATKNKS